MFYWWKCLLYNYCNWFPTKLCFAINIMATENFCLFYVSSENVFISHYDVEKTVSRVKTCRQSKPLNPSFEIYWIPIQMMKRLRPVINMLCASSLFIMKSMYWTSSTIGVLKLAIYARHPSSKPLPSWLLTSQRWLLTVTCMVTWQYWGDCS